MSIQEIKRQFEETQNALEERENAAGELEGLIARYREDERAGVRALAGRAQKRLDALAGGRGGVWERKQTPPPSLFPLLKPLF